MGKTAVAGDNLHLSELESLGIGFEETPVTKPVKKQSGIARPRPTKTKTVKVKNMDKSTFKKAKQAHKVEIAKLKAQRAKLKNDIKRHKMLIKQAKIVYKISKMKEQK